MIIETGFSGNAKSGAKAIIVKDSERIYKWKAMTLYKETPGGSKPSIGFSKC
jgi:hypothetical protein